MTGVCRILVLMTLTLVFYPGVSGAAGTEATPQLRLQRAPATGTTVRKDVKRLRSVHTLRLNPTTRRRLKPIEKELAKRTGPDLEASIRLRDIDEDLAVGIGEICGWDGDRIFQDKTAAHVFYYLPREFLLVRHKRGFALGVQYNPQSEPGQPSVTLTAELAAPYRTGELRLLKAILRQVMEVRAGAPVEARAIAGMKATADLQSLTTGLAIPGERVHVVPPTDLSKPVLLTLSLTQDEAEAALAQIAHEGLAGTLTVPVGDKTLNVGLRIQYGRFAGPRVEGFEPWLEGKPTKKLMNITPFPLQVRSLEAYRIRGGKLEHISKGLKETRPIPAAKARPFKLPPMNRVFAGEVVLAWLGTDLETDCEPCLKKIKAEVGRGVALAPATPVVLEAIPAIFDEFELYKLVVQVQSPYFVAGGGEVKQVELELTAETNRDQVLLYFPASKGPTPLLFRYQLRAVKQTGETIQESVWHDSREQSQILGSYQLRGLLEGGE